MVPASSDSQIHLASYHPLPFLHFLAFWYSSQFLYFLAFWYSHPFSLLLAFWYSHLFSLLLAFWYSSSFLHFLVFWHSPLFSLLLILPLLPELLSCMFFHSDADKYFPSNLPYNFVLPPAGTPHPSAYVLRIRLTPAPRRFRRS